MNQKIRLSQGIQYIIIGIAVAAFLMIWPLGVIQKTEVSKSNEVQLQESGPISVLNNGTQMFVAEGTNLKAVDLYVLNDMQSETITFRLYDGEYKQLWETFYVVEEDAQFPGFIHIPIDMEMEEGWAYYYTVEGLTKDLYLAYEDTASSNSLANGTLLYGGYEMQGINIIIRYIYNEPFSWWMTSIFGAILFAFAKVGCIATDKLFSQKLKDRNKEITVQNLIQWIANPILGVGVIVALLAVFPGRIFGVGVINYGFYYLGILLTAVVLFFGINYKRTGNNPLITKEIIVDKLPQWAMAICFAKVLWSCYEYMNGLYTVHHTWATCKILIWLSLAFLCTLKKEEWLKIWNLIYFIPAAVIAYQRYKPYIGLESEEALTCKWQAQMTLVVGFVVLQVLVSLIQLILKKRKQNGSFNFIYTGLFVTVIALMIVFRNTRSWPIIVAIMFGVFYYRMWLWEKRSYLMQIFCNGIILNFVYMVYYCLMHRPYLRFRHNRFGMGFHTVTMTGYYLALVLCAIVVRLFVRYYQIRRWQECWKELSLLGIANVYLFLTLSRTGYLAAFVMEIFMCIFMVCLKEKKKLSGIIKKLAVGIAVSVLFFPIVFTAQRIVPAVANDPIYSEIEVWEYVVEKGDRKDSELYIDIVAFIKVAGNKLFGIEMGNISLSSIGNNYYSDFEQKNVLDTKNDIVPVYITTDSVLVASEADMMEEVSDISNGRFEIFQEYIKQWNLTGHEKMQFQFPSGTTPAHAHNTFLQVIHDHGLITGALFTVFGVVSFFLSIYRYATVKQGCEEDAYNALPIAVILAFAAAGMVEWIFHFSNPFGFSIFIVIVPLLFTRKRESN